MFWIYKTKDMKELKVVVLFTQWAIKNEKSAILGKSYLVGDITPLAYLVKLVTRERERSKISKNGWHHLWMAPITIAGLV